jgi:hypothetical protein
LAGKPVDLGGLKTPRLAIGGRFAQYLKKPLAKS